MLFTVQDHLREHVIEMLAHRPNLLAHEIHERLLHTAKQCSQQAVFKELKNLQEEMVVVRVGQRYSLNLAWVSGFIELSNTIQQNYLRPDLLLELTPKGKSRTRWTFTDLFKLKGFWAELLLAIAQNTHAPVLLSWNPHAWAYLLERRSDSKFLNALHRNNTQMYKIVGGTTFLDTRFRSLWERNRIEYSFAESPFHGERSLYLNALDDYVVTVSLDDSTTRRIDTIYGKSSPTSALERESLVKLFRTRSRGIITLERNPKKAEVIYRKFKQYFGFREPRVLERRSLIKVSDMPCRKA